MRGWTAAHAATLLALVFLGGVPPIHAEKSSVTAANAGSDHWVHALAAFGEPKYPRDFSNFEYVNPDAPKGGTIYLRNPDRRTSFDKFNLSTVKGNAPAGVG